jgi:hypothetical protein
MYYAKRFPNFQEVIQALVKGAWYWSRHPAIEDRARLFKCERMCLFEDLWDWVHDRVRFVPDPEGVELLRSPLRTLGLDPQAPANLQRFGDCDDVALALAAILIAMNRLDQRFGVRYVFVRRVYDPEPSHVYVDGRHPQSGWVALDPLFADGPGQIARELQQEIHYRSTVFVV